MKFQTVWECLLQLLQEHDKYCLQKKVLIREKILRFTTDWDLKIRFTTRLNSTRQAYSYREAIQQRGWKKRTGLMGKDTLEKKHTFEKHCLDVRHLITTLINIIKRVRVFL